MSTPVLRLPARRILGFLAGRLGRDRRRILLLVALEGLWALSMCAGPYFVMLAIDRTIAMGNLGGLVALSLLYLANSALRLGILVFQIRIASRVGHSALGEIRRDLFRHAQRLPLSYYDRNGEQRVFVLLEQDVEPLERVVVWGPVDLAGALLSFSLAAVQIALCDSRLLLSLVPLVVLVVAGSEVLRIRGTGPLRLVREESNRITEHLAEAILGVRVLQVFQREHQNVEALRRLHQTHDAALDRSARLLAAYPAFLGLMYALATAAVLGLGGSLVLSGEMEVGEVAAVALLVGLLFGPLEDLATLREDLLRAAASVERILEFLEAPTRSFDAPGRSTRLPKKGELEFDRVGFRYPRRKRNVLVEVSFRVSPGRTLALVGRSGSGKSTVVGLLARLYEPTHGEIRIDGTPLSMISRASFRQWVGVVTQDPFLFSGTVLDNLKIARPEATLQEVIQAAKRLGAHELLLSLSEGYDTVVGERGEGLSLGQRQLLALVRILIANPRILVLDEATSAVDPGTERILSEAMIGLREERTTILVAHRPTTVRGADEILVLHRGRILERGDHESLLAARGRYQRLLASF